MWEISASDQLFTILVFFIYGALSCVFYDFIRAFRKSGSESFAAVFFSDIFFFAVSAFSFFLVCLARTKGEIRGFEIISTALGFLCIRITVSKILFPVLFGTVGFIFNLSRFISDKISRFCTAILKFLNNVILSLKKCLKNGKRVLYNRKNTKEGRGNPDEC